MNERAEHSDGVLVAVAAVALATTSYLIASRFDQEWGAAALLAISALPALALLALALPIRTGEHGPPAWLSAVYAAAFALTAGALLDLADLLGGSANEAAPGTLTWVGAVLAIGWGALAVARRSGLSAFLAAASAVVAVVSAVEWLADPDGVSTVRYVLVGCIVLLLAGAFELRRSRPGHAVALADVAGLAALSIAATFVVQVFFAAAFEGDDSGTGLAVAWGWELVLILSAAALATFAAFERAAGPGWIAAFCLFAFILLAQDTEDPSLVGWPLVLGVATLVLCGAAITRLQSLRGAGTASSRAGRSPTNDPDRAVH